jgi:DNA-binding beta-propeller fold protein YncE
MRTGLTLFRYRERAGVGLAVLCVAFLLAACAGRPTGLSRPNGVAVAPDGSLYVMDRGNYRVVHLSADGRLLGAFGRLGTAPDDIYAGWDIALDSAGNIYLCNLVSREDGSGLAYDEVKVFAPAGRLVREVGRQDYEYNDGLPRNAPYALDVDDQGRVYVADFGANTLRVFNAQGELLAKFFGQKGRDDGQFNGLGGVAVDNRRHLVYLTDYVNSRVQQFSLAVTASGELTLTHRLTFGSYGWEPGQLAYPQYLKVEEQSGRVYVSDMANQRIQVFGERGEYVAELSPLAPSHPAASGVKTWQVMGLALGQDGAVYAADTLNNTLWVFEPDGRLRGRIEVAP